MTARTVAILEPGYSDYGTERSVLEPLGARVVAVPAERDALSALSELNPTAVLIREREVTREVMAACPDLKLIARYGVGVDNVDIQAASERRIFVANIPDYGAEHEVSDHALALYLAVQRRVVSRDADVRRGLWGIGQAQQIPDRSDATLGLIGFGRIGVRAAAKFRAFGFDRVIVVDPYVSAKKIAASAMEKVDLDTLCRSADVISLHAPCGPETYHMLGDAQFALMKPTTILINVSRGGLVDDAALARALAEGRLFGAGIDVFEQEPPVADNPILGAPNTVLSDHTAWYSERSVTALQSKAAREVARVLSGECPKNWVNRWTG